MKTNQLIMLAVANERGPKNSRDFRVFNNVPHSPFLIPVNHQAENPMAKLWSLLKTLWLV